jgi:CDP-diacylglycerol--serine O-phosphatidyltransferase
MDKQKMLLSSETGHFSLLRALHLADLITELNGENLTPPLTVFAEAAVE